MDIDFKKVSVRQTLYLLIASTILSALVTLLLLPFNPENLPRFFISLVIIPVWIVLLIPLQRNHLQFVEWFSVCFVFILNIFNVFATGGLNSPNLYNLLETIIIATLFFGRRGAIATFLLTLVIAIFFPFIHISSRIFTSQEILVFHFSNFLIISLFFYFSYQWVQSELNHNRNLNKQLTASESRLKELIMNLPLCGMILRYTGEIDLINEEFIRVLGYTRDDLKTVDDWNAQVYLDVQTAEKRAEFWQQNKLINEKQIASSEMAVFSKDRKRVDFEVHATLLGSDVIVLLNNVTQRKEAEQALRVSEEKFRTIIEQSAESILLADEEGRIIQVNRAMEKLSGLTSADVLGETYWDFQAKITFKEIRSPEQTERNKQNILTALKSGDSSFGQPIEADFIRADGEKRTILSSAFIIRSDSGNRLCSMALDITERKRSAETMALQQAQLLEAEQKRRRTLETIESISFDLRKAEEKIPFYQILLHKCIDLLGARSGLVFEPAEDQFVFCVSQGMDWAGQSAQINGLLTGFAENAETVLVKHDKLFKHPVVLLKLLSEQKALGYIVLVWQDGEITEDVQTILQTITEIGGIALDRMRVLETMEERVKTRTRELRALYDVMQLYISNEDIQYVIRESLKIFLNSIRASASAFFLADAEEGSFELASLSGKDDRSFQAGQRYHLQDYGWEPVFQSDKPVLLRDALFPFTNQHHDPHSNHNRFIGVPVRADEGLLAVIGFLFSDEINVSLDELNLISLLSDQIAMVIERNRLRQQLKNAAIIEERQRLSRELHDSLTQSLYSLKLFTDAGRRLAKQQKWEELPGQLDTIFNISAQALKEVRLLVYELVPETIETLGLVTALEQRLNYVEKRSGVAVEFTHAGLMDLSQTAQMNLYRIAQEALNNTAKHAAATKIEVHLVRDHGHVSLQIIDNGKGFDFASLSPGMGLKNMRDRAQQLGGQIKIDSKLDTGTVVSFESGEALL